MKRLYILALSAIVMAAPVLSERVSAGGTRVEGQTADMRTRAEISTYEETSTYQDVTRIIDGLVATAGTLVHTESFGKSE